MPQTQVTIELPGPLLLAAVNDGEAGGGPALDPHLDELARQVNYHVGLQREQISLTRQALEAAVARFHALQDEFFAQAEAQLVALAVDIARKVLAQEVDAERYRVDPIVSEALASVGRCGQIVVSLNSADLARCELAARGDDSPAAKVRFVADDAVPPAGCRLETGEGTVVSSVDGRIDEISKALTNPE